MEQERVCETGRAGGDRGGPEGTDATQGGVLRCVDLGPGDTLLVRAHGFIFEVWAPLELNLVVSQLAARRDVVFETNQPIDDIGPGVF